MVNKGSQMTLSKRLILGVNAYHPDASVALFKNGQLVWAAEEERFNRVKHASGFPEQALRHCLDENGIAPETIDVVAISRNPHANFLRKILFALYQKPERSFLAGRLKALRRTIHFKDEFCESLGICKGALKTKFIYVEHHLTHVASAFYLSGFERAAFLSLDGLGDFSSAMWGYGEGNHLHVMDRIYFPHSVGFLYTAGTQFLGFLNFGDEYKVMGLAAYGKPVFCDEIRKMVFLKKNGKFELNLDYFMQHRGHSRIRWEGGKPEQDILYSQKWEQALGPIRRPDQPLSGRDKNIAASLQVVTEEIYSHILNHLYKKTQMQDLCLAGGVAYNSVANGKILKNTPFKNVYIQPAAGDAGTAIGAAAYVEYSLNQNPRKFIMTHALTGSEFSDEEIEKVLKERNLFYEKLDEATLIQRTVKALTEKKVIGWFQGRMEFGPRALGNRSIIADPRQPDMKDILNYRIKHREGFRPFAPMVPEEFAKDYFEMDCDSSAFMLKVFPVRPEKRALLPAITHVDGSARVQTVSQNDNPLLWKLLTEFGKVTGVPVLLNTSFNENEPVVCRPEEAINCFLKTKMDGLILRGFFVQKINNSVQV